MDLNMMLDLGLDLGFSKAPIIVNIVAPFLLAHRSALSRFIKAVVEVTN